MKQKTRIVLLATVAISASVLFLGCSSSRKPAHLVYQEDGKRYVYHPDAGRLRRALERGQVPDLKPRTAVYVFRFGGYYFDPDELDGIAALLSGNYELIEAPTPSHDGYFVRGGDKVVHRAVERTATERIGVTEEVRRVRLTKIDGGAELVMAWSDSPPRAIENTVIKWATVRRVVGRGNNTDWKRKPLIPLDDVIAFYGRPVEVRYERRAKVLNVIADR